MVRFSQLALALVGIVEARWLGIPTSPFKADDGLFSLSDISSIVVDEQFAESVNEKGETLIPPTLHAFGKTFANDLEEVGIKTTVEVGVEAAEGSLFITLGDASDYHDAAGRESPEGYSLTVSSSGIRITGASPLGAWWATRTILQQAILANGSIPYGSVVDTPGWNSRGMMLDAGRHYYPPEFLIELCAYMSFFKQNTFHLHLSDNLWNNKVNYTRERSLELYARFRLWSEAKELEGLNKHKNESYTRNQFDQIQSSCAARGVTVLPEIEAPGHALVFVQWKPELGLATDLSLLNISHPSTIPTMKTVWDTILPWFHTKTVHIGADEYTADIQDYNIFVNAMADHISSVSNKSIRIWGTFPPRTVPRGAPQIYRNVSIQHWEFFEDNPLHDYIRNDYSVMNSDDTYYVVTKWSGSYPQKVNITRTFIGNPATRGGGLWHPYVFDTKNVSNNPEINESRVLGSIVPLWNDYGPNSSVFSEVYYAWREGIPALADKQWGGDLNAQEFQQVFTTLHPFVPGQNLDRRVPSKAPTILEYSFNDEIGQAADPKVIPDLSGNGYNGSTDCKMPSTGSIAIKSCSLLTPLSSKGRDYTLTVSLQVDALTKPTNATLITGSDSTLMLTPEIAFFAGGEYFRLNNTLPLGKRLDLSIIGRGNQTFARIDNGDEMDFRTKMGVNGQKFEWGPMAFEAPLREIGGKESGWTGQVYALKLTNIG